ncbi:MAG: hypothetical protein IT382_07225, partial [Deltaproteobacteria bacterium]|nr:hypothetical protein [Deltaproteobacteria bacterium]
MSAPVSAPAAPPRQRRLLLVGSVLLLGAMLGPSGCFFACPGSEAQTFCIESAKVFCQLQYRCCTAVERSALFGNSNLQIGPFHDEMGCVDAYTRQCEASQQAVDESIRLGRTTFNAEQANECLSARREQVNECDASGLFNAADRTCDELFAGAVADGDACTSDGECADEGSQCELDPISGDDGSVTITLEGTCRGQGDEGEPCLPGGLCNGELRCLTDPTTYEQRCAPPGGAGASCAMDADCQSGLRCAYDESYQLVCSAPGAAGDACDSDVDCGESLRCLQDLDYNYVCTVPGAAGVPCSSEAECGAGLLCAQDPESYRDLCTAPRADGESCAEYQDGVCKPGLECGYDGFTGEHFCVDGSAGDPCQGTSGRCQAGLICRQNNVSGRDECQAPLLLNAPCDPYESQCDPTLRCVENASYQDVCQAALGVGATCELDTVDPCDANSRCEYDSGAGGYRCAARVASGQACSADDDCAGGLYCDSAGNDTCVGVKAENQLCTRVAECSAGL